MAVSKREFYVELYQEHLEEAACLYEQWTSLYEDPEITWRDIGGYQARFEAHIDALVIGESLALEVCQEQSQKGDFGELHAATCVFCRQNRQDLVLEVLDELDSDDPERLQAVLDALEAEFPDAWLEPFVQHTPDAGSKLVPIMSGLVGHRRLKAAEHLLTWLEESTDDPPLSLVQALGRIGERRAGSRLLHLLRSQDEALCVTAAIALLRLGELQTIHFCLQAAQSQRWPVLPLALSAGATVCKNLLELLPKREADKDGMIALGLLGDIAGIPMLLAGLNDEALARAAAIALQLITGAQLYEEVFIPEEIDEDVLTEKELEKLREGGVLTRPDGKPSGENIVRLSQNLEEWQTWWSENKARFNPTTRYRNGRPYSPTGLLENLVLETSPHVVRKLAYEELVIRYGADFAFEADMLLVHQERALKQAETWVQIHGNRFRPGTWYFAGEPIR